MTQTGESAPPEGSKQGRLVLVGTPLGNREDLSPRARRTILEADLLLCEDTRSPARLLGDALPSTERVSCFVGNEHERTELMLRRLEAGAVVVYVSEAGLPVWSDPGRLLVEAALSAGHVVDVVPGPTAATLALCVSGFEAEGARFIGFVPRSGPPRNEALDDVLRDRGASLIYEAGGRVGGLLRDLRARSLAIGMGDESTRRVVVARELTKLHQEVLRGSLAEVSARVGDSVRGEVVVVLEGAPHTIEPSDREAFARDSARAVLTAMTDSTLRPRERARQIAKLTGLDDREVYELLSRQGRSTAQD